MEELINMISLGLPYDKIYSLWLEKKKGLVKLDLIEKYTNMYYSIYDDTFLEYDSYTVNDNGEKVYNYVVDITIPGTNDIDPLYVEIIDNGLIKPTLELYLEENIDIDNVTIDVLEFINFYKEQLGINNNDTLDERLKKIAIKYPEREQSTWDKQEREALAYNTDSTALTPFIDGIVMTRGIDKDILVSKILEKAVGFATISGIAVGYRQKAEDLISTIDSLETLKNVIDTINNDNKAFNELMSQ